MQLPIPTLHTKYLYLLTSANNTSIGNKTIKFIQEKLISFELINETASDLFFSYHLYNQFMQGSSLLHYWSEDMDYLQSDMIFITDKEGTLKDIYKFNLLFQKFEKYIIPTVKAKYPTAFCDPLIESTATLLKDKEQYIQTFIGYSSWRFFFQNLYRKYREQEEQHLHIKNYFGLIDLPLIIKRNTIPSDSGKSVNTIENKAVLDTKHFDKKAFARMLKDLTGIYNIDASLRIDMEEKYFFSKNGSFSDGEIYLNTSVADWYSVTTAQQLKQLTSEAFEMENNNMNDKKIIAEQKSNLV